MTDEEAKVLLISEFDHCCWEYCACARGKCPECGFCDTAEAYDKAIDALETRDSADCVRVLPEISMANAKALGLNVIENQLIEECAELIKAMHKLYRAEGRSGYQKTEKGVFEAGNDVLAEIADVEICIEQFKYLTSTVADVEELKEKAYRKVAERYGVEHD